MGRPNEALVEAQARDGYVTVAEAARLTKVTERGIRTWTRTGRVTTKRIGAMVFVNLESLRQVAGIARAS